MLYKNIHENNHIQPLDADDFCHGVYDYWLSLIFYYENTCFLKRVHVKINVRKHLNSVKKKSILIG